MTNTCMCKRGFFMLRDCGNPAERPCQSCARPVCRLHLSPRTGTTTCLECEARQGQAAEDDVTSASWAYGYRHRYYSQGGYSPVFWGTGSDEYYDDYDFRPFDREEAGGPAEENVGAGGEFYES